MQSINLPRSLKNETQTPPRRAAQRRWLDTRWFILVVLFGVAAVFGLPLLWYSRGFSWPAKIAWTILVVLYTGVLLWLTWLILSYCYASISRDLKGVWPGLFM